ncbi:MAG: hypothetical protein ACP5QK_09450 [Myxococcota bacterium]
MKKYIFIIFLIFACSQREMDVNIVNDSCEFLQNQREYKIRCRNSEFSISKDDVSISISRDGSVIWQTFSYMSDNEFSPFSFKTGDGYICV